MAAGQAARIACAKQRVRQTCEMLASLGVPTATIVDFDVLRDEAAVRDLVDALGGELGPYDGLLTSVCAQLRSLAANEAPTKADLVGAIDAALEHVDDGDALSHSHLRQVADAARESSECSQLKRHGIGQTSLTKGGTSRMPATASWQPSSAASSEA